MTVRAIDIHEDAILSVLAMMDAGDTYAEALAPIATAWSLTTDRLDHLVRVWCAIAGVSSSYDLRRVTP
jgi:hypothetical protein